MGYTGKQMRGRSCYSFRAFILVLTMLSISGVCIAQTTSRREDPFSQELNKYPGLLPELAKLTARLKQEVAFPPDRNQSRLLPLLPKSTTGYASFPNYGDAGHQALIIFQQELQQSAPLRDWLQHGENGSALLKFEDAVQKFYELSQYLGDEIVIAGDTSSLKSNVVLLAEVHKPGLKNFLRQLLQEMPQTPKPMLRILDLQELATTQDTPNQGFVVLVREDFMVAGPDVESVKLFNKTLDQRTRAFPSSPFGQRLTRSYQDGVSVVVAADLQRMLQQLPGDPEQAKAMLNGSGFDNVKFLVWEHKTVGGQAISRAELSFDGPRHGIPGWLAPPTTLGSLDYVSPQAVSVAAVKLQNFAEIFDAVRGLVTLANPAAFASLDQMQQMMNVNLRNDVLQYLQGEVALELDGLIEEQPAWRATFSVSDPGRLQQTLSKLLAATGQAQKPSSDESGTKFYSVFVPSGRTPVQITYTFDNGHLVIASSPDSASQAIQMHRSGTSFAKSAKFLASKPQDRSEQTSGLLYYDPVSMTAARMQAASPEVAQLLAQMQSSPVVLRAYGDEDAIRVSGNSGGADAAGILIVAAIAIPNLLRAKVSANEASAVGTMRTIVTAQVEYSKLYPQKGFARDLVSLGGGRNGTSSSAEHAGLMEWNEGGADCLMSTSCIKDGYRFTIVARCGDNKCREFAVLATPLSTNTGVRSFCTTSDGVLRFTMSPTSAATISSAECRQWPPIQ